MKDAVDLLLRLQFSAAHEVTGEGVAAYLLAEKKPNILPLVLEAITFTEQLKGALGPNV